ncbi:MAG: hypothetical protein ACKV2O_11165 [Acidimicrobiales bacterium]
MAVIDTGGSTSGKADVDLEYNLKVALPVGAPGALPQTAGFAALLLERDAGAYSGDRALAAASVSARNRLTVGQPTRLLREVFSSTAINSALWDTTVTTFAVAVAGGFVTLNSGAVTTANAVARLLSRQSFPAPLDGGLEAVAVGMLSQVPQSNNVVEIGFSISTGTAAPTDGAFFRYDAGASLKAVINNNGSEITSPIITGYSSPNVRYAWRIETTQDDVHFYINGTLVATILSPTGTGKPFLAESLPFQVREYNSASPPALAQQIKIAAVYVGWQDTGGQDVPGHHLQTFMGRVGAQGQTGMTMGTTANFANSANPTAAVPTNTTAALGTGLGGQFWETDTLAVTTDGIICSFANPAGTNANSGKTLMVTGITIDSFVQTALTGGGYNAVWSLAFGHTGVALNTAEAAATKAPRRVALGANSVAAGAVALTQLARISQTFENPIPVLPGEFIAAVKKKVGTAPSAGVIAHIISIDSYWI